MRSVTQGPSKRSAKLAQRKVNRRIGKVQASLDRMREKFKRNILEIVRRHWPLTEDDLTEYEEAVAKHPARDPGLRTWELELYAECRKRLAAGEGPP